MWPTRRFGRRRSTRCLHSQAKAVLRPAARVGTGNRSFGDHHRHRAIEFHQTETLQTRLQPLATSPEQHRMSPPMRSFASTLLTTSLLCGSVCAQTRPHNVVLFVADGLRAGMVNQNTTPTIDALMHRGVRFTNTHSLFPTFTTANASGMATGHMLGDTGDFSNTIYSAFPVTGARDSLTPFLESDPVLGDVD